MVYKDHPRSRGVYPRGAGLHYCLPGSSPLARGLPPGVLPVCRARGIIPARAGFTERSQSRNRRDKDHPRSRGVYGGVPVVAGHGGGSSPLARGLRARGRRGPPTGRIIPARAGFTGKRQRRAPLSADHPRSRGVYLYVCSSGAFVLGSSPLARGLRIEGDVDRVQ